MFGDCSISMIHVLRMLVSLGFGRTHHQKGVYLMGMGVPMLCSIGMSF